MSAEDKSYKHSVPDLFQQQPTEGAIPPLYDLNGLGSVVSQQVEQLVNQRLAEERRERALKDSQEQLQQVRQQLAEKKQDIKNLTLEHKNKQDALEQKIQDQAQEIENLNKSLKDKKTFKYYAGLTGDILQSFGIKKEVIAKPLAGLLSQEDEPKPPSIYHTDQSGIVEESEEHKHIQGADNPHTEMLNLLKMYLEQLDTLTLEKVFKIFSEIEDQPQKADAIIQFLEPSTKNI